MEVNSKARRMLLVVFFSGIVAPIVASDSFLDASMAALLSTGEKFDTLLLVFDDDSDSVKELTNKKVSSDFTLCSFAFQDVQDIFK